MNDTVLVIDDEDSIRSALARLLGSQGYRTRQFASAEACLDFLKADANPACVIADLLLPGIDGLELQRILGKRFPMIVLTGHADIPSVIKAMSGGAIDFLEKPVLENRLLAAVERGVALAKNSFLADQEQAALLLRAKRLTPREREVMALVITGLRNKAIASKLGIVEKTIKVHRAHIMQKLEVNSLADMVRCADKLRESGG